MMVVVPTAGHVKLEFRPSMIDRFAYVLTIVGFGLLLWFRRQDRRSRSRSTSQLDSAEKPQVNEMPNNIDSVGSEIV